MKCIRRLFIASLVEVLWPHSSFMQKLPLKTSILLFKQIFANEKSIKLLLLLALTLLLFRFVNIRWSNKND